jgi:DNA-binding transcriptional LysR family regulator
VTPSERRLAPVVYTSTRMDHRRLLLTVWNWLPAFKVVAETEHLPTASTRLRVTPSALSRSITMLEDRIGRPLFTRRGRQLVLNADGRRLLAGMTTAFAALDESVATLSGAGLDGPLYASAAGPLAQMLVLPALLDLQSHGRGLVPYVYGYDHEEAIRLLRAGKLDVVFDSTRSEESDLVTTFLGDTANGVYCGREHPLFAGNGAEQRELLSHGFVVTCSPSDDRATDAFPSGVPRLVKMYVHQTSVALEACLNGSLLAVLPEFAARGFVRQGELRRLVFDGLLPTGLYATYARIHARDARVCGVVEAVAEARAAAVEQAVREDATSLRPVARLPAQTGIHDHDDAWLASGEALFTRGELQAARVAYDEALASRRVKEGASTVDGARHMLCISRLLVSEGKYEEVERRCEETLLRLGGADPHLAALLGATAALACSFRGDEVRARAALDRARKVAIEEVGHGGRAFHRMRALVQRAEGNLLVVCGRPHDALQAYREGADAAAAGDDTWEHSIALFNLAEAYVMLGDGGRAKELLDAATREKETIGDRWGLAHVHQLRARVELSDQRPERAIEEIRLALQLAVGLTDPRLISTCNATLGEAHLASGDHEEAQRAFDLARDDAERCGARAEIIRAWVGLSATDLGRAKHASAKRWAKKALELAREGGGRLALATTLATLADVASGEDRHPEAAALYRDALAARLGRAPNP